MAVVKTVQDESLTAIGDAIRAKTGTNDLLQFPNGMIEAINSIQGGGGGSDTYGIDYMLTALPFLNKVEWTTTEPSYDEHWENPYSVAGFSGLITSAFGGDITMAIIPPWITEVQDGAIENIQSYIIFTSKTPPIIGMQGMWAEWGGCCPPQAIFVPDEALEAYKAEPNLVEFAHLIKPLSEYNGEGYYGGKL